MKEVRLLPEALEEFEAAAERYEGRAVGLGETFTDAVEDPLESIRKQPNQCPRWEADERLRKVKTRRFPYVLFYEELPSVVLVVAVAHGRRKPGYWSSR